MKQNKNPEWLERLAEIGKECGENEKGRTSPCERKARAKPSSIVYL